ncbi:Pentatricopeptide repeat-containing protein At4g37170 [Linum grandiflorum]
MRLQKSKSLCSHPVFHHEILTSSSSSSQTRSRPSPPDDHVTRLCRENKFREAIDLLCVDNRVRDAIRILNQMDRPSAAIYSAVIQSCVKTRSLENGRKVHQHIKQSGFLPGQFISNRLLDMYVKCDGMDEARKYFDEMGGKDLCSWNVLVSGYAKLGLLGEARKLFDEMPDRDHFAWNAMISGYVRCDMPEEALDLCRMMNKCYKSMNKFTVSSAIAAAAVLSCLRIGKEIHGHIMRTGLDLDHVVWSSLCDMYGKCRSIDEARCIFDRMVDKDDVTTWTNMISTYFEHGRKSEGIALFKNMVESGTIRPNEFTFAAVLNACSDVTPDEELGKQVHGYMTRICSNPVSFSGSALVHLYSKCGNMVSAERVFKMMENPDLVSWTSLITGYAQNGLPNEALRLFELLLKSDKVRPDHVTFVGVLSACAHAGLVDEGIAYFNSIKEKHGLNHTADHYACVIDMLARSGRFDEAERIISEMNMKPDKYIWASLLGGCRIHKNIELAEKCAEALFEIEPWNPATYVTMANVYAASGRWSSVAKIRKLMECRGVTKKKPGKSWIQIKRKTHAFSVGDQSHPESKQIYEFLCEITMRMKEQGFVADVNSALHDVEEEQKEQHLSYHSEKLAVAYGIISTPAGMPIKVFKNLRTCVDCHEAIKFVSKIARRKITVRDSARFHCFENGSCSCGDYW